MNKLLTIFLMFAVTIAAVMALPDLKVDSISISQVDPAISGSYASVLIDFSNVGNESASMASYNVSFDNGVSLSRTIPVFNAASSTRHIVEVLTNVSGAHNVTATIDSLNIINESNEANNAKSLSFNVADPVKNVTLNSISLSGTAGGTASATMNVQNTGNDALDVSFASTALSNGSVSVSSSSVTLTPSSTTISVGQTKPIPVSVAIPAGTALGTYTGTITVTYAGGSKTTPITLNIIPPTANFNVGGDVSMNGERGSSLSDTFTVSNNGTDAMTFELSESVSDLDLSFDASTFTLTAGAQKTVTVSTTIPNGIDAKTYSGTISVKGSNNQTKTVPAQVVVKSKLGFDSVTLIINDDDKKADDGDEFDVSAGDTIDLEVIVENLFSDREDKDIKSIDIKAEVIGSDWEEDDSESVGTLSAEEQNDADSDIAKFSFTVDSGVDDGDEYELRITAAGTDEDGADHEAVMSITLNINKEDDELKISEFTVIPSLISCVNGTGDYDFDIELNVENTGSNDQDNIEVKVTNSLLGLSVLENNIDLNDGKDEDVTLTQKVSNVRPGSYTITAKASNDDASDSETKSVTISSCGSTPITPAIAPVDNSLPNGVRLVGSANSGSLGIGGAAVAQEKDTASTDALIVGVLALSILAALGLGIFLIVRYW